MREQRDGAFENISLPEGVSLREVGGSLPIMSFSTGKRILLWGLPVALLVIAGAVLVYLVLARSATSSPRTHKANEDPTGFTLQHVMIVHRHGLRAPSHLSNWSNPDDYPMGVGYLTKLGKQGSLRVGEILRRFYGNFLTYSPREVWARSSTYPRCYETEYLLLGTLYPPRSFWDFGLSVQPIPITMVPNGNDVLIESCTASVPGDFKYMYNETHRELQEDGFETFGDFMEWLAENSGWSTENSEFYEPIIDALYAQKYNGLHVPEWAEAKWKSMDWALRRLSFDYWKLSVPYYGQYMGKMIANRTLGSAEGSHRNRLSIMSYHDTSIQAILSALKFDHVAMYPSFLGALHFQLYKRDSDGEFYVRSIYSRGFTACGDYRDASQITIQDCPFPDCTLKKFVAVMNGLYPDTNRSSCPPIDLKALL
ncbi:putative acid phosphatase 5 [Galendromus occidentalis]|uniref:acid phosphatase n=1 Tax=Galendromus occidentalis TaxID=34638 RepID=A0AAJ6QZ02_9ACAR|nr:putative acid phosphatase 5 [Galendromus occidentalis]